MLNTSLFQETFEAVGIQIEKIDVLLVYSGKPSDLVNLYNVAAVVWSLK